MKTSYTITLSQKDIEKAGIQNSPSGMLIDELAYSAGQYTSEDLYQQGWEFEPREPYQFNYEDDLIENTKTNDQLVAMVQKLNDYGWDNGVAHVSISFNEGTEGLYAGAYCAIKYPETWEEMVRNYKKMLIDQGVDSVSDTFSNELQKEIDEYQADQYREWLYGDHRNWEGVVYLIAKYFTNARDGIYTQKTGEYSFILDEYDVEDAKNSGYNKKQLKQWILDSVSLKGHARKEKERAEYEKRKAERERLAQYKKEQKEEEDKKRMAKLLDKKL